MTIQEIARRAKVSIATVSRTINRVPSVRPALARRVHKVIQEVGYYPNTNARALVSGRSRIFGLMVSEITNPFFPEIVQTFEDLGFAHHYEILLCSTAQDAERFEVTSRRMIERRVDGVAILTFGKEEQFIEVFSRRNVPVVVVDVEGADLLLQTVHIDYQHGIRQAVQHLAALRHTRIAFISGPAVSRTAMARKMAFRKAMEEIGLEIPPKLLVGGDHTMEAGMKAMSELASLPDRPSAVVCSNDLTAIGAMRQAFELGLRVPSELSVVGFDDIRLAQYTTPPLTTVRMSQTEIAKLAFRALLNSVESQRNGTSHEAYTIRTDLVIRRSTAIAPKRFGPTARPRGKARQYLGPQSVPSK
jgi:DNA-binding LacI/PurR family transcriptional regulator